MLNLSNLKPNEGTRKSRRRVGRGTGSGWGKTSGRGQGGQWSRSGAGVKVGFEGGQMPLYRRLPKRGFSNYPFKKIYSEINVETLNVFEDGTKITKELLVQEGLLKNIQKDGLKILGDGELNKKLEIEAEKFTKSAIEKIEAMGGKAEVI